MLCKKCKKTIPENSKFCNLCGAKQEIDSYKKKRGNGQGCVYKSKSGKWTAEVTLGYDKKEMPDNTIKLLRKKATKTGFDTKKEALEYLPHLKLDIQPQDKNIKFKDLYEKWLALHTEKVVKSTIDCYKAAYKYFAPLHYVEFAKIRTEHLQSCVDNCPKGNRTKKNMKSLTSALFEYCMQLDIVDRNYAKFIYIRSEEVTEKTVFTSQQLKLMWEKVTEISDLKYILILCYTGMRLGEMLSAETKKYNAEEGYFITGSKTEAGKDRIITISPKILPFFADFGKGEHLFFDNGKTPSEKKFRNNIYYSALKQINLDIIDEDGNHIYNPHCCRHTFATLMKKIEAPATDKQKLIGHSKFEMTAYYTHTDIDSLKAITNYI